MTPVLVCRWLPGEAVARGGPFFGRRGGSEPCRLPSFVEASGGVADVVSGFNGVPFAARLKLRENPLEGANGPVLSAESGEIVTVPIEGLRVALREPCWRTRD